MMEFVPAEADTEMMGKGKLFYWIPATCLRRHKFRGNDIIYYFWREAAISLTAVIAVWMCSSVLNGPIPNRTAP